MSNLVKTAAQFMQQDNVKQRFSEILKDNAPQFITAVINAVQKNEMLSQADPQSVYLCALQAASMNLSIDPNLGHAYLIPYRDKDKGQIATFQMGYKGFIQLAQRSGQFKRIAATKVYEGQLIEENPLLGNIYDWKAKKSDRVIGYASYFELLNGYEASLFMSVEEAEKHGKKYSQTFKKGFGVWKDDFDSMAIKTVIKLLLSRFAPLSTEMQRAVQLDQSKVIDEMGNAEYIDNSKEIEIPQGVEVENNFEG